MNNFVLRFLPSFMQQAPERYLNRKFLYQLIACTGYFVFGVYGFHEYGDILFWLNIPEMGKLIIIFFSVVPFFMGFMGFFIVLGVIVNLPFQIIKEIYRTLFEK